MRTGARSLAYLLIVGSVAFVASAFSHAGEQVEASAESALPLSFISSYVARLISVDSDRDAAFIAHIRDCYLPVWSRLRSDGIVSSVSVFELSGYDSTTTPPSVRDYLVLAELGPQAKPEDLMNAETASACPEHGDIPTFSVLRTAHMSCTPNSCYGMLEPVYEDAASGLDFLVELIGVEDTPHALAKYRDLVSEYFGPANGLLVESGMLHCFFALESTELLSDTPGGVPWNQIHISDDWDVAGDVDWEAVYAELFRRELGCDLDSVWAELPPTTETSADYHGRLIPELCIR